jgi:hypothetical protein
MSNPDNLRKKTLQILANFKEGDEDYQHAADQIMAIIDAYTLEARVDELEMLPQVEFDKPFAHKSGRYRNHSRFIIQYAKKRLAHLKEQGKE